MLIFTINDQLEENEITDHCAQITIAYPSWFFETNGGGEIIIDNAARPPDDGHTHIFYNL